MGVIDRTDLPLVVHDGELEFRTAEQGDQSVAWVRLPAGTDLRPALVGLPGDLCSAPHWGYMIAGRLVMHYADHDETYEAGQAYYWPAGHAPEAVTDCEFFEVSPTEAMRPVLDHLTGAGAPA